MSSTKKKEGISINKNEMENIVTTAFIKELKSYKYQEKYTSELRLKVLYTYYKVVQMIQCCDEKNE